MLQPPPSSTLFPYTTIFRSLVQHDAERVDIGAVIDVGLALALLGRHVRRRAEHEASLRLVRRHTVRAGQLRDAEVRSEEHTSELQSLTNLVCRLLLEKKKQR